MFKHSMEHVQTFGWSMDHGVKALEKAFWMDHFRHTHTHTHTLPLAWHKGDLVYEAFCFFCSWEKAFWVDHFPHRVSLSSVAKRFPFWGLVSSCGAGAVSRTHHTTAFLGGGACLPAKRNRKTSPVFSLSLSIGGMKEIRLMMPFVFLQLGKSILDGPFPTHTHTLSLSLLLGTKKIRLMRHFVFLQLGKSILDGPYPTNTHTHSPWLGAKEIRRMKHFVFLRSASPIGNAQKTHLWKTRPQNVQSALKTH